jgi:bacteriorhodopsin
MTDDEHRFKRNGRQLVWLMVLWIPTMCGIAYFTKSEWLFAIVAVIYIAAVAVISVQRFTDISTHEESRMTEILLWKTKLGHDKPPR